MVSIKYLSTFVMIWFCHLLIGCSDETLYIYDKDEFDRNSPSVLHGLLNRESVTICSSNYSPDLKREFELAQSECALFEKDAVLTKTSFSECPLLTPKAIIFKCLSKQKK
jgi:hypothetical protein